MGRLTIPGPDHGFRPGVCGACGADVLWAQFANGRGVQLNTEPIVTYVPQGEGRAEMRRAFTSHWDTCPQLAKARRPKS